MLSKFLNKDLGIVDIVVLIFTLTIAIIMIEASVKAIFSDQPMPEKRAELFSDVLNSVISMITLYVGAQMHKIATRDALGRQSWDSEKPTPEKPNTPQIK